MNKRVLIPVFLVVILLAVVPLARAQDEPELICPAFPDSPTELRVSYYVGEGMGYSTSGELSKAIDSFSCIVEQIDPAYVPAYMARAALYMQYHSYEESVADYTSAIERSPDLPAAYNNRGIAYAALADYEKALADFDHVLTADSGYVLTYINRGVIRAIQGEFDPAITDLEQAISVSGIDAVYAELSDPDRSPDAPKPEFDPTHAQAYALLGTIRSMQAAAYYDAYLTLTGDRADTRIVSAAGSLESRLTFELRLDDGTWLFAAGFSPTGE